MFFFPTHRPVIMEILKVFQGCLTNLAAIIEVIFKPTTNWSLNDSLTTDCNHRIFEFWFCCFVLFERQKIHNFQWSSSLFLLPHSFHGKLNITKVIFRKNEDKNWRASEFRINLMKNCLGRIIRRQTSFQFVRTNSQGCLFSYLFFASHKILIRLIKSWDTIFYSQRCSLAFRILCTVAIVFCLIFTAWQLFVVIC